MTTPLITTLNQIQAIILEYFIPIIYVIGATTNLLNIILFSRRRLRLNCCSWYFIFLSLLQFLLLNTNCLLRMIISWTNYDGFSTIDSLCKIRSYFNVLILVLTRHFLCLISIDRWLVTSTNVSRRNKSSLNNVRWIICISFCFWIIFSIHTPINYIVRSIGCSPSPNSNYAIFSTIYNTTTSSIPFFLIIIFSLLTVNNIRRSSRRKNPIIPALYSRTNIHILAISNQPRDNNRLIKKRRDMDFIRLTLFQIIPYLLFNSISSFSPIFLYINSISINRTTETTAQVTFIHNFGIYLLYFYVSVS